MSTTYVPAELRRLVRERAQDCCEYCLIPESATFAPHEIDHVIAEKHGGQTESLNLAWSCTVCNKNKGSDLASIDRESGQLIALFHPHHDSWSDHFQLVSGRIEPLSATGRVTVRLLQLNLPERIAERELLLAAGLMRVPGG